jgi:Tfp pilus assembly protein PilO
MKIKNRQDFLLVLTIAAFALLVGVNFLFEPLQGWWTARTTQIKDLREKVSAGNQLIKREAFTRSQWDGMRTNALPANSSLAEQQLLTDFTTWSRSSGAEITGIMPQWRNDSTNYWTLDCRVEAAGDLGSLSKFLYSVEKGPTALKIDSLELSARDATGHQLTLALQINGLALFQSNQK